MIFVGLTFRFGFPTQYSAGNHQGLPSSRYISSYMPQLENPAESSQPCPYGRYTWTSSTLQLSSLGTVIYVEAIPALRRADALRPIRFSVYASPVLFMRLSVVCYPVTGKNSLSPHSASSATLDTGGWLILTRQGLPPCKMHQASLGALTPHITGKIKVQSEAAQLYFVRVHVIVYAQHGHELMG